MRKLSPVLIAVWFNILVAVVGFLVLELGMRYRFAAWPFQEALYRPDYLSPRDAPLRWRFSSNDGRNSLGLRNRELNPKKFGTRRILFLGDSLIWSGTTSSGELYTAVVEGRLNSHPGTRNTPVEIINAGVPGYTTYQELEFLKIYGLDMKPDLVILGFVFNDLYYPYLHSGVGKNKLLEFEPETYLHHLDPRSVPGLLLGWSYLAHYLAHQGKFLLKKIGQSPMFPFKSQWHIFSFEVVPDAYLAWKSYGWGHAEALIGEMKAILSERGIPLKVLVFPIIDQVNDAYRKLDEAYVLYPQSKIREICNRHEIPLLDLTDPIYRNGGVTLFRDYFHLNEKGNDLIADELAKHLLADGP
jgi:lysophospholipase L1-like esterase